MKKEENLKEKFRQALTSTIKVISDDYKPSFDKKSKNLKDYNFFELDNLNSRSDFIRFRAEADSEALKKKFSNIEIYKKYLPNNTSCKSFAKIAGGGNKEKTYFVRLKSIIFVLFLKRTSTSF